MKATKLLSQQHREVEALFAKLEKGSGRAMDVVHELANNLAAHMVIEQEIFYPAAREADEDMVLESFEEHAVARFALRRLLHVTGVSETFEARVTTLKELIEHHVKEEEHTLFPEVEDALGDEQLEKLGAQMEKLFEQVKAKGYEAVLSKTTKKSRIGKGEAASPRGNKAQPRHAKQH